MYCLCKRLPGVMFSNICMDGDNGSGSDTHRIATSCRIDAPPVVPWPVSQARITRPCLRDFFFKNQPSYGVLAEGTLGRRRRRHWATGRPPGVSRPLTRWRCDKRPAIPPVGVSCFFSQGVRGQSVELHCV
ncbi:uncharacterized protein CIMG_12945 [Coccidioides immitis RS]|uniref:Uncharacterized protein n=1 Tax=Coccidioides immitis (strain RS) TaxID=246410 RepID=A0A0D8JVU5_COCIM|nr:uncharacterized protein CIMG_12945 [Coccidioides immitis RS]KJF60403.1 hypothetical protein CIMG_12945 [Coccidioides immitis RS]